MMNCRFFYRLRSCSSGLHAVLWALAIMVFAVQLLPTSARADGPNAAIPFDVNKRPDRAHFPDFSDNEFASITPAAQFYPFVLDVWPQRWLPASYFSFDSTYYAPDTTVKLQAIPLLDHQDPISRSHTISLLTSAANPTAAEMLLKCLASEQDAALITDLLTALARLHIPVPATQVARYLDHENSGIRHAARQLYVSLADADLKALAQHIGQESNSMLQAQEWHLLAERAENTDRSLWPALLNSPDESLQHLGLTVAFRLGAVDRKTLTDIPKTGSVPAKQALAKALPGQLAADEANALLGALLSDAHGTVLAQSLSATARCQEKWNASERHLPRLLALSRHADSNIRQTTANTLRHFPVEKAFQRLVVMLADASPLTRREARESLLAMKDNYPVDAKVGDFIGHKQRLIRLNVCRLLRALNSNRHADQLTKQLGLESEPINVAAVLGALAAAKATQAEKKALALAKNEAAVIREAVAIYIGANQPKPGLPIIRDYALKDRDKTVREAAIEAMGSGRNPTFAKALLEILERTDYSSMSNPEFLSGNDRSVACWAIMRLPKLTDDLRSQLQRNITQKVIRTPMGPSYDDARVRASCCWALASHARFGNNDADKRAAEAMATYLETTTDPLASISPPLRCYGYQAGRFLARAPMDRTPAKPLEFRFNFRKLK